jgi:Ca-activated chloride channel family protein
MNWGWLMALVTVVAGVGVGTVLGAKQRSGGSQDSVATFRSAVELVRVSAVVRNKKGRFVQDLTAGDFEVLEGGLKRPITDCQRDVAGISVAILLDVSGSMEAQLANARQAGNHVLSWLDRERDEAAVYTFDTRLQEVTSFMSGLQVLPEKLALLTPFGATSLHDAIAQTAQRVGAREGRRRAVVVLTDGLDNASRLTPGEVSGIASSIDVPVYVVGVVSAIDNPSAPVAALGAARSPLSGGLADLSAWTGGRAFVVSTNAERSLAARQLVDELRHQYLIAFESSGKPGWHPLEVRARDKDLTVRARSGYFTGQSRPISH